MPIYLIYLVLFFGLPVFVLGFRQRRLFRAYRRTLLWCFIFVYTLGWLWDWLSVRTGVWYYDSAPTLGLWIGGLPVEEFVGFYVLGTLFIFLVISTILEKTSKPS